MSLKSGRAKLIFSAILSAAALLAAEPQAHAIFDFLKPAAPAKEKAKAPPAPKQICQEILQSEPPFFVSTSINSKDPQTNWENLRDVKDTSLIKAYVPRHSIVRRQKTGDIPNKKSGSTTFVPVEVISVPSLLTDEQAGRSRNPIKSRVVGKPRRATVGTKGFVSQAALEQIGTYTFLVNEDAPMLDIGGSATSLAGFAIKLMQTPDGKFRTQRCCPEPYNEKDPACLNKYVFEIFDPITKQKVKSPIAIETEQCSDFLSHVRALPDEVVTPIAEILKVTQSQTLGDLASLQIIDSMGMIKLPSDAEKQIGPYGSWHYTPDKGAEVADDSFMNITSACAFLKVLEAHQKVCTSPGCEVQWGDAYHPRQWATHKSHETGYCIDVRPLKKTPSRDGLRVNYKKGTNYDWAKSKELIQLMERAGATKICFNDKRNIPGYYCKDHDDHIHVCFDPHDEKVQNVCSGGTLLRKP